MLSFRARENIKTFLTILAAAAAAALVVWFFYAQWQNCREDGYSYTECNAILLGRSVVLHGRGN